MLCQLVCVDRRYQRMNSFNIRELQSILQRRFFTDLVNTADHRRLIDTSIIATRFKSNTTDLIRQDQSLFYNFGISNLPKPQANSFLNSTYYSENIIIPTYPSLIQINGFLVTGITSQNLPIAIDP